MANENSRENNGSKDIDKPIRDYRIRKACFDDAADIFEIGEKSFTKYGMEEFEFSMIAELLEDYPNYSIVAEKKGKILGFILAKPYEDSKTRFYIYWVGVDSKFRGKGIGSALIEKITEIARKNGFKTIIIDTQRSNKRMVKLLKRLRFNVIEEEIFFSKKID